MIILSPPRKTTIPSSEDLRRIDVVFLLCQNAPALFSTLGETLKLNNARIGAWFGIKQTGALKRWLSQWNQYFEIRPVPNKIPEILCGLTGKDPLYWGQDVVKQHVFTIPELTLFSKCSGRIESIENDVNNHIKVTICHIAGVTQDHYIPGLFHPAIKVGDLVQVGYPLTNEFLAPPKPPQPVPPQPVPSQPVPPQPVPPQPVPPQPVPPQPVPPQPVPPQPVPPQLDKTSDDRLSSSTEKGDETYRSRKAELLKKFAKENERKSVFSFWDTLATAHWKYCLRDVVRFHTSVKSGALTILSGTSGVGKSSLFKLYARFATGTKDEGILWKRMNVVSTWMDPSDMLGWRSPLTSGDTDFQDAPGGLQTFLEGLQNPDRSGKLSLLCFEEMNLAQAELYFSDFLQAISDSPDNRSISNPNGDSFKIPNLRIVGTCNIDHTTKPFTERFLDRCSYIQLGDTALDNQFFFPKELPSENLSFSSLSPRPPATNIVTSDDIESIRRVFLQQPEEWEKLVTALKGLHLYPSPRVRMSMVEYILARPALDDSKKVESLDIDKATIDEETNTKLGFDEAVVQRILPKLFLQTDWNRDARFQEWMNNLNDACSKMGLTLSENFVTNELKKSSPASN